MAVGIKIGEIMRKSVVTVSPSDTAEKALEYMVDLDIGCVIVVENEKVAGIVTDSNLLERVFIKRDDPQKVKITDIMSHPVRTMKPEDDVERATQVMRDLEVKRLPVVKDNKLVGLLTEADVIAISPAIFEIVRETCEMRTGLPTGDSKNQYTGICESCGNFSETLHRNKGTLLCENCSE